MADHTTVERRASQIKLLLMDCDGVLTDGRIWILESGDDQKTFNTRDGLGLDLLHRAGLSSGIISGRESSALQQRAEALGILFIYQGVENKVAAFEHIMAKAAIEPSEVAYVGDDLNDIPLMRRSELAVAVADATEETKRHAHYVTRAAGGEGAVRETIELILKAQNRWDDLIKRYVD
ncbi:MAG TPA: HAD hydrolase family protein [Pyrinomonadaceae bacterium]|nr:HAD hydrolase family protein [Pyrinomonadaceae bacterium]